jgi:hypothetical protein
MAAFFSMRVPDKRLFSRVSLFFFLMQIDGRIYVYIKCSRQKSIFMCTTILKSHPRRKADSRRLCVYTPALFSQPINPHTEFNLNLQVQHPSGFLPG